MIWMLRYFVRQHYFNLSLNTNDMDAKTPRSTKFLFYLSLDTNYQLCGCYNTPCDIEELLVIWVFIKKITFLWRCLVWHWIFCSIKLRKVATIFLCNCVIYNSTLFRYMGIPRIVLKRIASECTSVVCYKNCFDE